MQIYLIRHTTPAVAAGYAYGQSDLEVLASFEQEAQAIQAILPKNLGQYPCYSSPLQRCKKLAEFLSLNPPLLRDEIMELNFGDWELKPWSSITSDYWAKWQQDFTEMPTPNGESYRDLYQRAVKFWEEVVSQKNDYTSIVTHFGVIQSLLAYLLHIPLDKSFKININYGAVIRVELQPKRERVHFLK